MKSKVISSINGNLKQDKDLNAKSQLKMDHEINPSHLEKESKLNLLGFNNANAVPLINPRKGDYLLNRTHSTEGIASKLSLELKKKYLLGGTAFGGSVMKSGSASNVDTQLRNFTDAISQHQKLLNPAPEPSPTMQAFLQGTSKLRSNNTQLSPISPTAIFSSVKPYMANRSSQNLLNNDNPIYKSTILPEISKTQLPDLVKESSILKSKTTPNIVCGESKNTESKEIVKEQVAPSQLHAAKNCEILGNARNCENTENNFAGNMDENNGFRPRSPLHETSIIVPQVDWSKNTEERKETASTGDSEIDSDSLSSGDGEAEEEAQDQPPPVMNLSPPRLQIHSTDGDLLLDEEAEKCKDFDDGQSFEPDSIECSFLQDKMLNNNKIFSSAVPATPCVNKTSMELEIVKNEIEQLELQDEGKKSISNCSTPTSITSAISNKHDDSEENDVTTAALTETEFSEWARDGEVLVSDDLRDVEFNINPEFITTRRKLALSDASKTQDRTPITIAKEEDLTDMDLDSSKLDKQLDVPVNNTSKLLANGENIDFMDTDNESLLDDSLQDASNMVMLKNRGYVEFVNIKSASTLASSQDKLIADAPIAKLEVENDSEEEAYYDKNVIEINPITMDDVMNKLNGSVNKAENDGKSEGDMEIKSNSIQQDQSIAEAVNKELFQSMEEDSLLIVEPAEDTTTSEVVTILASPVNPQVSIIASQTEKQSGQEEEETKTAADLNNPDYLEYVKRLQSRIAEFSNAKDSIDVRKSKRKNSKSSLQSRTAEMIAEEIKNQETTINNSFNSPATSRKLEEITRERFKQKNVIQDLLMDKVEAHKQKSAEKKARRAARASSFNSTSALSPIRPSIPSSSLVNKFVPTSIVTPENSPSHSINSAESKQPVEIKKSHETRQLPWKSETEKVTNEESNKNDIQSSENITLIKIANETENNFRTPIAPPRLKHEEAKRTAEKARQDARERARLKSDEDLGLSPEDKIKELRMKVARRQLSMEERKTKEETQPEDPRIRLYTYGANKTELKLQTSKSTDNMKAVAEAINFSGLSAANAKSMDELLHADSPKSNSSIIKRDKKQKTKDPERRKSIIQAVSDFFFKKESSPSPSNQKDKLSMFRLTSKTKGKVRILYFLFSP